MEAIATVTVSGMGKKDVGCRESVEKYSVMQRTYYKYHTLP